MFQMVAVFFILQTTLGIAAENPPAQVVISEIAVKKMPREQDFLGVLYYERTSQISSEVSGLVTTAKIAQGQQVKKNDPLIVLDTELLEKEIAIHQNQMELSKLNIDHLEKNFARMEALYKKGSASEMVYDEALFAYQNARLNQLSTQTNLEKLLIQKRKSIINAPFDGVILTKNVDSGSWVSPGKLLLDIGSVNDLFVKVPVAETLLRYLKLGQTVDVNIHAYNTKLTGVIENLSPFADEKTKNVFLKIRISSLQKVAQNMSASVRIPTGISEPLAIIPRDALIKFQGKDYVFAIQKEKAVMLSVNIVRYMGTEIGADNAHFIPGMQVIVDGNERLRAGQPVIVTGKK
ncbi:MAG: efflux RND transporter periplasmic adaptor subunit [Proteobacteria bacterium]|nr:efflux RND transporter periplasmic adaptor subunit [Pseudomonadota bacterium]MBU1388580.1 efflux RND transporter periplasmic adaptor subunit [Pseudomonadota bacterium]MBU1541736.1 efflux RND transporter periplasmic adaptor subunit [Pseudomonadota bacterium]MBU2431567.1 efflux RND transporter periplasmic adaptor subunit [Pseudomonadota bacterium]MBU2481503.1 efflux RND transporter periplasmic adaptor subunit [Pseudomonadota bacterium]